MGRKEKPSSGTPHSPSKKHCQPAVDHPGVSGPVVAGAGLGQHTQPDTRAQPPTWAHRHAETHPGMLRCRRQHADVCTPDYPHPGPISLGPRAPQPGTTSNSRPPLLRGCEAVLALPGAPRGCFCLPPREPSKRVCLTPSPKLGAAASAPFHRGPGHVTQQVGGGQDMWKHTPNQTRACMCVHRGGAQGHCTDPSLGGATRTHTPGWRAPASMSFVP